MALAFGKKAARTSSTGNPITTASFTINQNEKILVLMLKTVGSTNRAGAAPSYAGVSMTQANSTQKAAVSPEASCELWYLLDPTVGTATCTIPNTGAATIFYTLATVQTSNYATGHVSLDNANGGNNTATNPTPGAVTCTTEQGIGFAITAGGWTTWAPSAQAGTILANTDDGADGGGEQYLVTTAPGSYTLSWTFGTSDDWGAVAAFFKEVTPPVMNNYQFLKVGDGMSVSEKIR